MFYSKLTGGFYSIEINGANIPADAVEITDVEHAGLLAAENAGGIISADAGGRPYVNAMSLGMVKSGLVARIDGAVARIYSNWMRFESEYTAREAAARAFVSANYTGNPGIWVTSYATAAEKTNKQAADLIILQADGLRAALASLGALRMRKYEIASAASPELAKQKHDEIITAAKAIAAGL